MFLHLVHFVEHVRTCGIMKRLEMHVHTGTTRQHGLDERQDVQ